ncbi:outer membrane lipoprotein [Actinobacillus equuli]|nr:outer membrane lipoprotein [Actinobacillus equuli]
MNFKKVLGVALVSALALTGCNEEKKRMQQRHKPLQKLKSA